MTIDEAIQNSKEAAAYLGIHHQDRLAKSVLLSIEALKLYKSCGHPTRCGMLIRLPGETEE